MAKLKLDLQPVFSRKQTFRIRTKSRGTAVFSTGADEESRRAREKPAAKIMDTRG